MSPMCLQLHAVAFRLHCDEYSYWRDRDSLLQELLSEWPLVRAPLAPTTSLWFQYSLCFLTVHQEQFQFHMIVWSFPITVSYDSMVFSFTLPTNLFYIIDIGRLILQSLWQPYIYICASHLSSDSYVQHTRFVDGSPWMSAGGLPSTHQVTAGLSSRNVYCYVLFIRHF